MIIERGKRKRGLLAFLLLLVMLPGCALTGKRSVPNLKFSSPETGTKIEASGNASEPAKVETEKRQTEIPLPPNSQVSFVECVKDANGQLTPDAQREIRVSVPTPTVFRQTVTRDSVVQAKAFAPPAPPSPSELAKGKATLWFWAAGGLLGLGSLLLLYLGHGKAAGFAVLGAIAVPALASLYSSKAALLVGSILLAISVTLYVAWYLLKPKIKLAASLPPDSPLAKSLSDE